MPGSTPIGASRRGPARPAVKRTSVCGESSVPWLRSSPSSDSRNRRVRHARSDPVSARDPWPVTRPAASRMRAVSDVKGTITPPNGSAATIVRSAGVSSASSPSIASLKSCSRPAVKDS